MSQLILKSPNGYSVHLDDYCLNCNGLFDRLTKNQRFCSTKWGRNCAKEFKSKVNKKLEKIPESQRYAVKWQMYNPGKLKIIRDRYVSKNLDKVRKSRSRTALRHKLIKRVIKMDFMPILIKGKAI